MKRLILILSIASVTLSACQPDYSGWLSQVPDSEELSKKPIKPVPQEIPVTRPELSSERNEYMEVVDGVYNFSWKLFRQYYQQKQDNVLMAPFSMMNVLNRKLRSKSELAQTRLIKSMHIGEDLIDKVDAYFHAMEDFQDHPGLWDTNIRMNHNYAIEQDGSIMHQLSFKGQWRVNFDEANTRKAIFHKADGTKKEVNMMYRDAFAYYYAIREYVVVRVYLFGTDFQMFFILPNEDFTIDDAMSAFYPYTLRTQNYKKVRLWMPKFTIQDSKQLDAGIINSLSGADLNDSVDEQPEKNWVKQDCFIAIDEEGINDGTDLERYEYGFENEFATDIETFRLDRPFIFGVTYRLNYPLFLGYYGY